MVAVVSALKSAAVGGGTLAGSGRGIAASIASSAAFERDVSLGPAMAEVGIAALADTARKLAATAISTRSNPPRLFEQSRIVTPLWVNCPGKRTVPVIVRELRLKASAVKSGMPARYDSYADDTQASFSAPSRNGATHDKLTSAETLCNGLCALAMRFFIGLSPAG